MVQGLPHPHPCPDSPHGQPRPVILSPSPSPGHTEARNEAGVPLCLRAGAPRIWVSGNYTHRGREGGSVVSHMLHIHEVLTSTPPHTH